MQPTAIEYAPARVPLTWSKAAIFSFLAGFLVGPVGFIVLCWGDNILLSAGLLALLCAAGFGSAISTIVRLKRARSQRGEWLAVWGLVLSFLWMILYSLLLLLGLLLN